jgi:hypothetical protein
MTSYHVVLDPVCKKNVVLDIARSACLNNQTRYYILCSLNRLPKSRKTVLLAWCSDRAMDVLVITFDLIVRIHGWLLGDNGGCIAELYIIYYLFVN